MTKYVAFLNYTPEGWARILEHGLDRMASFKKLVTDLGGTFEGGYFMLSHYDGFVLFDIPDEVTAMAMMAQGMASGQFKSLEIHPLIDAQGQREMIKKAQTFDYHHPAHPEAARHN